MGDNGCVPEHSAVVKKISASNHHAPIAPSVSQDSNKASNEFNSNTFFICNADGIRTATVAEENTQKPSRTASTSNSDTWAKILDSIAKILASIAWPGAAIIIAYYFKKEIAALLARLKKFKAGATEAEFSELLREVAQTVESSVPPKAPEVRPEDLENAMLARLSRMRWWNSARR